MKSIVNRLKRLNEALPLLLLAILVYGILVGVIGIWFAEDKIRYCTGLLIGIACAIGMAIHISMVISDAVRDNNPKMLSIKSVLRYLAVCVIFFVMMQFNLGSLLPAVIGLLGLKVAAYAQPLLYKVLNKNMGGEGSKKEK